MTLPVTFSNILAPQQPTLPQLDQNFAALGLLPPLIGTLAGSNVLFFTPATNTPAIVLPLRIGQIFAAIAALNNTGGTNITIPGLTALNVYKDTSGGPVVLTGGEIIENTYTQFIYDPALNAGAGGFHLGVSPSLGVATSAGLNIAGAQAIPFSPVTNNPVTLTSFVVHGTTAAVSQREFLAIYSFTSNKGSGESSPDTDKVTLYAEIDAVSGTGDVWVMNGVLTQEAGSGLTYNAQWVEIDFNNFLANRGETPGLSGFVAPVSNGISLSGDGTAQGGFHCTSGIAIEGAEWNRGVTVIHALQAGFQEVSGATRGLDMRGSYSYAIDTLTAGIGGYAIRIGNDTFIGTRDSGNSVDVNLIGLATSNIVIGDPNSGSLNQYGNLLPISPTPTTAASYPAIGQNSVFTYKNCYLQNDVTVTSDPSLKENIRPLPATQDIVASINPIIFNWIGGDDVDWVETSETQTVHATEMVTWEEDVVKVVNGVATQVKQTKTEEKHLYDYLPVVNPDGTQVIDVRPAKPAVMGKDKDGNPVVVREARPEKRAPKVHRVPRMVQVAVKSKKAVVKTGATDHWGFDAKQVGAYFAGKGLGFGGHVVGADGLELMRPGQLIPILWKRAQEMDAEITELKKLVATLVAK